MKNRFYFVMMLMINLYYKIFKRPILKQELLLRLALKEKGFVIRELNIVCDHNLGLNYVNGVMLEIKYPDSFFNKANELIPKNKTCNFYFNGNMDESGQRELLLKPFVNMPNSKVISSNEGRIMSKKDKFNKAYFFDFAKAKYGLCPHQADWPGSIEHMWTYRFIESCFVKAIPILFKKTPLGEKFINGFHVLWDEQTTINQDNWISNYNPIFAHDNQILSKKRFCLTEIECEKIKETLKKN